MSNNLNSKKLLLLGAGPMAMDYAKVLKHLGIDFTVIGKSVEGTENFYKQVGVTAIPHGLSNWKQKGSGSVRCGIIAVNCDALANTAIELMDEGVRKILLEKPAGLTTQQIKRVCVHAKKTRSNVYIAYNRRFYASVREAQKL
ncbi:MAG: Gfo/Idh/MocA family oxidoreductase, partial [Nitrospina sp.]|nr:Gfo/Idh/MocA family oxidoreductase [Nitrospina sp.]